MRPLFHCSTSVYGLFGIQPYKWVVSSRNAWINYTLEIRRLPGRKEGTEMSISTTGVSFPQRFRPGAHVVSDTPTESITRVLALDEQRKRNREKEREREREKRERSGRGVTAAGVDSILSDFEEASSRDLDQAEWPEAFLSEETSSSPLRFCVLRTCREYIRPSCKKIKAVNKLEVNPSVGA